MLDLWLLVDLVFCGFRMGLVFIWLSSAVCHSFWLFCCSAFSGLLVLVLVIYAVFDLLLVWFIVVLFTSRFGLCFNWFWYVCYACVVCGFIDLLFS